MRLRVSLFNARSINRKTAYILAREEGEGWRDIWPWSLRKNIKYQRWRIFSRRNGVHTETYDESASKLARCDPLRFAANYFRLGEAWRDAQIPRKLIKGASSRHRGAGARVTRELPPTRGKDAVLSQVSLVARIFL